MRVRVVFASSEVTPYAKTGGLADVSAALPKSLRRRSVDVSVVMPRYRGEMAGQRGQRIIGDLVVPFAEGRLVVEVYRDDAHGVAVYLLDAPPYFDRPGIYGPTPGQEYSDNAERFAFFSRAVIEFVRRWDTPPQVIHCNDWQTGFIPLYLREVYRDDPFFRQTATLFTIHNLAYHGLFDPSLLGRFGFPGEVYRTDGGVEFYGQASALKAGLVAATALSTVSRRYAEEIQTPEYGCGLDGLLRWRRQDLVGILNGVDYEEWNPATDPYVAARYSLDDLDGKRMCKADLMARFGLELNLERPIIGCISRLVEQKGFDLLRQAAPRIMERDLALVILGTGEPELERYFRSLPAAYPGRVGVYVGFSHELAHKIEAGADMFLMPSRYEPSGLNQMYSLAYGTVPIVRATGGLDDTIENFDPQTRRGNGFKFSEYHPDALTAKIAEALSVYARKDLWRALMENGMRADFSWDRSAEQYIGLYERLARSVAARGASQP